MTLCSDVVRFVGQEPSLPCAVRATLGEDTHPELVEVPVGEYLMQLPLVGA